MKNYLDLMERVLWEGEDRTDRTGIGTYSLYDTRLIYDLGRGFPMLTTKKLHWKSVAHELLWFLKGEPNISYLKANGVSIWDEWADEQGNVGPMYGVQWRRWRGLGYDSTNEEFTVNTTDQIAGLINAIKEDYTSRRLIVNAWNVGDLSFMRLPPCHMSFQCYVHNDGRFDLKMHQRSCDVFLGLPFNIASYALLTHMLAMVASTSVRPLKPGRLIIDLGDTHLYKNHLSQARQQLEREPRPLPHLVIKRVVSDIDDFLFEDFELVGYEPHPHIAAAVAV